jgi:hypothetical protein
LTEREAELVPVPYFHLVLTLPAAIAGIAFHAETHLKAIEPLPNVPGALSDARNRLAARRGLLSAVLRK